MLNKEVLILRRQTKETMKRLKTILSLSLAMLFISAMTFTSCGGKKESKNEDTTEQSGENEHPTEGEHPTDADSTGGEHPKAGATTEHPKNEEHPTDN